MKVECPRCENEFHTDEEGEFGNALSAYRCRRFEDALRYLEEGLPDEFFGFAEDVINHLRKDNKQ